MLITLSVSEQTKNGSKSSGCPEMLGVFLMWKSQSVRIFLVGMSPERVVQSVFVFLTDVPVGLAWHCKRALIRSNIYF